ncbi:MAG: class I SAM-dependent methyltransferase [Spirochaetia bacterium]
MVVNTGRSFVYTGSVAAPQTKFPLDYINKTVSLKYFGRESVFHLSHGLFSSNDVDAGSRLLLKSIAQRLDLSRLGSVLDVGCGMGVIGIAIARAAPGAHLVFQDRDALAVAFARENSRANGVENAEFDCGLAFWNLGGRAFDLVVSNLPAKAGRPVLESFFRIVPHFLSRSGTGAVVIVTPLEGLARDSIQSSGCLLFHVESTSRHSVFFFQRPEKLPAPAEPLVSLAPYLRTSRKFSSGDVDYELETAYNLPDFDTVGYGVELAQEVLQRAVIQGSAVFWNPGQGHLPVFAEKKSPEGLDTVLIAGHDALELAITEHNLAAAGRQGARALLLPTDAGLAETLEPGSMDLLCATLRPVPKAPWPADLVTSAEALLRKGGALMAAGESTEVFRVLGLCRKFKILDSKKRFGHRAVLLQRQ